VERVLFALPELPPLRPDVAKDRARYTTWVREREAERLRIPPRAHVDLALIMLVNGDAHEAIRRTVSRLRDQTSSRWSLAVVVDWSRVSEIQAIMREHLPRKLLRRTAVIGAPAGTTVAGLLDLALSDRAGLPVATIFPGDVWAPDAVALLGAALTPETIAYADEDVLTDSGTHEAPRLKPDWSPEFQRSSGYIGRPLALGASVAASVFGLDANDLESIERACANVAGAAARRVHHVSEVLCHRSSTPSSPRTFTAKSDIAAGTSVSIVVPFRDQPRFLRSCVDSVRATSDDLSVEFVLVDNGTVDPETCTLLERLAEDESVTIVRDDRPFNWAQLSNAGAQAARGSVLLFLNNDIEARRPGWLSALCAHALRPDVGAVGARLLYPDGRLQHCGVVVGLGGAAGHPLVGLYGEDAGYLSMAVATRECSAVTGACLATRRVVFDELNGFDESLGVDLNDIDLCLRAGACGYRTLYEPSAELVHYESPSRGTAGGVGDLVRFIERWKGYIVQGDPYLNPHLTRADPSCGLAGMHERDAWNQWYSTIVAW
jgi:GT2 family glycosyltransferase